MKNVLIVILGALIGLAGWVALYLISPERMTGLFLTVLTLSIVSIIVAIASPSRR